MDLVLASDPEQPQRSSERALVQHLLDALPSAALLIAPDERIAAVNVQAERLLDYEAPMLEGRFAHDVLGCVCHTQAGAASECPVTQALRSGKAEGARQMRVKCRDGNTKPVEFGCAPYPTEQGRGIIFTLRDLTLQLELEQDLRRLASIAESSPIAIVELNEDANLVHANPAMMKLLERFGFSADARPAILPAQIQQLATECLRTRAEIGGLEVTAGRNHYEWKLVPVGGENLVRGYGVDVSARKEAEIELLKAKFSAEAAARAKTEFLANTKHEIRSPAYVISGVADLLLSEPGLTDEQYDYVRTVKTSVESLMEVLDAILETASLENGAARFEISTVDFRACMAEILAPWAQKAEMNGLRFAVSISSRVPAQIECDRVRLAELLNHIVSNAIKFTTHGEVVVEADRDTIGTTEQAGGAAGFLFFSVRDTGVGIPRNQQDAIFDSFSQVDGSSTRAYGGTGLGLTIAKRIVELMGGRIGVESEPGRGSRFWFTVPMEQPVEPYLAESRPSLPEFTLER
jgi:PAS domain S-box-containing protein